MDRYFLNNRIDTNPRGDHEVHKEGCHRMPRKDVTDLGLHKDCHGAMIAAMEHYDNVDACIECSFGCHTG